MGAIVKTERAYNCLENFRNNCGNNEYKKLIDLFVPMLYEENKHHLEISIGKKQSKSAFQSFLSMTTCSFIVKLSHWNNEPQFIIQDRTTRMSATNTVLNLALIKDLHIEFESNRCYIDFNYNSEIDYRIYIVLRD